MRQQPPVPRFTVITLGVSDIRRSIAFYQALGFQRKFPRDRRGSGVLSIPAAPSSRCSRAQSLPRTRTLPDQNGRAAFGGFTLAWNWSSIEEVDAVLEFAISKGASRLKPAHSTDYGGYSGYFVDPDGYPWEVVVAPRHQSRRRPARSSAGLMSQALWSLSIE
jgi:catechol 2,3-dioxygenase-like lactoylglutathione lyase family enzyme